MKHQQNLPDSQRAIEILLLENNTADLRLFLLTMPTLHHITVAESGSQALDVLFRRGKYNKTPAPDLIVMDLNTPTVNGFDVLKTVKSNSVLRSIPVVVWSNSSAPEDVQRAYDLGASAYLVKPGEWETLESTLTALARFWLDHVVYPCRALGAGGTA